MCVKNKLLFLYKNQLHYDKFKICSKIRDYNMINNTLTPSLSQVMIFMSKLYNTECNSSVSKL